MVQHSRVRARCHNGYPVLTKFMVVTRAPLYSMNHGWYTLTRRISRLRRRERAVLPVVSDRPMSRLIGIEWNQLQAPLIPIAPFKLGHCPSNELVVVRIKKIFFLFRNMSSRINVFIKTHSEIRSLVREVKHCVY